LLECTKNPETIERFALESTGLVVLQVSLLLDLSDPLVFSSLLRRKEDSSMTVPFLTVWHPAWLAETIDWQRRYLTDTDKMALAILLSRANVTHGTGEPFGAAIFSAADGQVVAVGMSQVVQQRNSVLHAEVMAIMMAEQRLQAYHLGGSGQQYELFSSCEPCAMCLGAIHWSQVTRLVCGATREDAQQIGFDEGPVFPESYAYLEARGIAIVRGVLRADARAVIEAYATGGGLIHNRQT
jgi:tRNA(Arg) A34 adenosine deaminase TadA